MEEVNSKDMWWYNEVVVPSLSTSLCLRMVSGPGALLLLRNLTNLMRVGAQQLPRALVHFQRQVYSHLSPQENKNICCYPR